MVNPYTRHPALLAMETATLAGIAPGRVVLGLGTGVRHWIEDQMKIPTPQALDTLRDAVDVLRRLWAGEHVTYRGASFSLGDVALEFKPAPPDLPIVLGVKAPRALALAGDIADGVVCSVMSSPAHVRRVRETTAAGRRRAGRDDACPIAAYVPVAIGADGAAARRAVRPLLARYLAHLHGQMILADAGVPGAQTAAIRAARARGESGATLVTDEQIDTFALAGTPDHARRRLAAWVGAGLDTPIALPAGEADPVEQLGRIAAELGPWLRDLRMRFGVHVPTCIEGMMYPVPFARPADILPSALLCEELGFDSVWGNDHMTTQRYVQREFPDPPNFFEPLVTFSYCAARTTRLRFATGIIVLPMRNMPVLAKQVATLDQLSGGRVILGVGTGAYREEYEALFPDARGVRRGDHRRRGHAGAPPALHRATGDLPRPRRALRGRRVLSEARADADADLRGRQSPGGPATGGAVRAGLDARRALPRRDPPRRRGRPPRRRGGGAGRLRHRHRAAIRGVDRAHPRGGRPALSRPPSSSSISNRSRTRRSARRRAASSSAP